MKKIYTFVKVSALLLLLLIQNSLEAQNCCLDCQADVKMISDKQVLLDKIEIKQGTTATLNTGLYVSYKSGNTQKFLANLAIATAGVVVSTQLNSTPVTAGDSKIASGISPIIPLGVSVAALPSIWKNRPRGLPQAELYLLHRDINGKLLNTWEQPISKEAKNSAELLNIAIDKPLSAGTLEVYLQNGSNNEVYYWGLNTTKSFIPLQKEQKEVVVAKTQEPLISSLSIVGCPNGFVSNGQGKCYNSINNQYLKEGTKENPGILRIEKGTRMLDLTSKFNLVDRKLLPPKPIKPDDPLICLHYWWCEGNDCIYLDSQCYDEADNNGNTGGTFDPPQTKTSGYSSNLLTGNGFISNFFVPVITSYESGTLTKANSQSP